MSFAAVLGRRGLTFCTATRRLQQQQQQHRPTLVSAVTRSFASTQTGTTRQNDNAPSTPPPPPPLSNRRQFRQIPVNPKLLQYIRDLQVCKPVRQAAARRLDRWSASASASRPLVQGKPPRPFGPTAIVRQRQSIRATDTDMQARFDKLNPHRIPTVALCGRSNVGRFRQEFCVLGWRLT